MSVSFDRTATLRAAEKLLRLGKLSAAITEYTRLVEENPRDWESALTLASLHVRAKNVDRAIDQYAAIADALCLEGDASRAADLYVRILAIRPGDEHALGQAADLAVGRGDAAAAREYLLQLAEGRLARGDRTSAVDALSSILDFDPADAAVRGRVFDLSLESGAFDRAREHAVTPLQYRKVADALLAANQTDDAVSILRHVVERDPEDRAAVAHLARVLVAKGDAAGAAEIITPEMAGDDSDARVALLELFLRGGRHDAALDLAEETIADDAATAEGIARLAGLAAPHVPAPAFRLVDMAVQRWTGQLMWDPAAAALQQFVARAPACTEALVRLVEVAVDGGLTATAAHAQEMLADTCLATGSIAEGLAIAEDLVAREPGNLVHIARVRQAQELQREHAQRRHRVTSAPEAEPDTTILPFRVSTAS